MLHVENSCIPNLRAILLKKTVQDNKECALYVIAGFPDHCLPSREAVESKHVCTVCYAIRHPLKRERERDGGGGGKVYLEIDLVQRI